jgi:hypothetical protein
VTSRLVCAANDANETQIVAKARVGGAFGQRGTAGLDVSKTACNLRIIDRLAVKKRSSEAHAVVGRQRGNLAL